MKTILITGGAGYIGSAIAYLLQQKNYHVVILDSLHHDQVFDASLAPFYKDDFANKKILKNIFSTYTIEAVIHCAAFIEVGLSVKNPSFFYETNVSKTITLLQTMLEYNVKKIIFSSSAAVYGIPRLLPINENHPLNPINPYGKTKLIIEMVLEDFCLAYDMRYIALRYFNAAGCIPEANIKEQHKPETHIIPLLLSAALENKPFHIFGNDYQTKDGTAVRDYIHVADIAHIHKKALDYLAANGKSTAFNVCTGVGFSNLDIINILEKMTGRKIHITFAPKRKGDPKILIGNPTKAKLLLGWIPLNSSIEVIIGSILNREHTKNQGGDCTITSLM